MFRFFCQIISLLAFCSLTLTGCLTWAAGPSDGADDFSGRQGLKAMVWHLAGWLEPAEAAAEGQGKTVRSITAPDGVVSDGLKLSMTFDEPLASWPSALEVQCRVPSAQSPVAVSDARPFGGPNLKGTLDEGFLTECLSIFAQKLGQGQWLSEPQWEQLEPGLFVATVKAFFGPRFGPRELFLVKISPKYFRLSPYLENENETWKNDQVGVGGWIKRLPQAAVVINGGQYYPNRTYMGLLKRGGKVISGTTHKSFMGFIVQDDVEESVQTAEQSQAAEQSLAAEQSQAGILDLDTAPLASRRPESYPTAIQSYMVLDRLGRTRVKSSDKLASRLAIGEDAAGDFVVAINQGAMTLADLAGLMDNLGLVSVLGLDGGLEAQLAIEVEVEGEGEGYGERQTRIFAGRYANNFLGTFLIDDFQPSLPSVIAFERRASNAPTRPLEP
ncbi:MAG: phosphodiester glycosidase family protein [Deltaproteobacteria bacterium]|jgi:hypothetical protein|nr:phosphodiester glycosidase family protein [Deltaproteobacteria bacterium]